MGCVACTEPQCLYKGALYLLLIVCNFVIYCFDLIAHCNLAHFMTNSAFNPTGADDGSVNVRARACVCVCVCSYIYIYI